MNGLTILGTNTEVGKTYVACAILKQLVSVGCNAAAYKPVASGATSLETSDGYRLWQASECHGSLQDVCPQSFAAPLAPPLAAELESRSVDEDLVVRGAFAWFDRCDVLVVEGAGGLMSPIGWGMTNAYLAQQLQFPMVLVAENRLGVVNQVLTTLLAAENLALRVAAVVLNEVQDSDPKKFDEHVRLIRPFLKLRDRDLPIVRLALHSSSFEPRIDWRQMAKLGNLRVNRPSFTIEDDPPERWEPIED